MDNSVLIPSKPTKKSTIVNWVFVINFVVSITALILGSVAVLKKVNMFYNMIIHSPQLSI